MVDDMLVATFRGMVRRVIIVNIVNIPLKSSSSLRTVPTFTMELASEPVSKSESEPEPEP